MSGRTLPADAAECTFGALAHVSRPREALVAGEAPALGQLAMHVQQPLRSRALVQIVDVLRDQQQLAGPFGIQPGQGLVGSVGLDRPQLCPTGVVEGVNQRGVAAKSLGGADILDPMPFPQSVRAAKGGTGRFPPKRRRRSG